MFWPNAHSVVLSLRNYTVTTSPGWLAFVDESMPHPRPGIEPSYIIAAALLDEKDCAETRWLVSELAGKRPRFHWRDAKPDLRSCAVKLVASLPALHLIVVGAPLDRRKQERARRVALERMLYELEARGVDRVRLEARTPTLNQRDRELVDAARSKGIAHVDLQVAHEYPSIEPLLWIPDIVAGAYGNAYVDYRARFNVVTELVKVSLT